MCIHSNAHVLDAKVQRTGVAIVSGEVRLAVEFNWIWCLENSMRPIFSKIRVVSVTRKTNVLNYQYRLGNSVILRTGCIKDLGVHIDCKLHLHRHVDFLFSHSMKLLGLIRTLTFSFSTTVCYILLWSDLNWSMLLLLGICYNYWLQ
jgi:hypothetical protein